MNIIQQALQFVQSLLCPANPRCCPRCHKTLTKKNGARAVTIRDLDGRGAHAERHQNWWCYLCRRSYYVADPRRAKYARYTRRVQRKGLDMYCHLGGSLRTVVDFLRAEVNGNERYWIWDPLRRREAGPAQAVRLSHAALWRWLQRAGHQAQQAEQAGRWRGVVRTSGALVADSTWVLIRGVQTPIHWSGDAVKQVGLRLQRLPAESELTIRGQFRAALESWGLRAAQIKILLSDGASWYQAVVAALLRQAHQQRSLFHLWRQLLPALRRYRAEVGGATAKELRVALQKVWNAASLAQAQRFLAKVRRKWGYHPLLHEVFARSAQTLPQALTHTLRLVQGIERSSTVAERFFRRYKQRVKRMGGFMSQAGCDCFNAVWQVYSNMEKYQKRKERKRNYRYPGRSPLEVAEVELSGLTWLDLIGL